MASLETGVLLMGDAPSAELARWAKRIEGWGYGTLWLADERFFREVYASLTLCALNTERLRLGTCVTDPFSRHPALTAMAIATVDEVSEGRVVLGLGVGVAGFGELGLRPRRPAVALREAVEVVRGLLQGRKVELLGRTTTLRGAELEFEPRRPEVPVYIASNSPLGLRAAGEVADGVIVSSCGDEASIASALEAVRRGAEAVGRSVGDLKVVARLNCCVSDNAEGARDAVRLSVVRTFLTYPGSLAGSGLPIPEVLLEEIRETGYTHDAGTLRRLASRVPDDVIDAATLAGTVDGVVDRLARLMEAGVDEVIIRPSAAKGEGIGETLRRFATGVMPALRGRMED